MKTKFVKTTLSLSLLLLVSAPATAFAGTNCDSVPLNQSMVKNLNCSVLNANIADYIKKQNCFNLESYFTFDGGKLQLVSDNNCQLKVNNSNKNQILKNMKPAQKTVKIKTTNEANNATNTVPTKEVTTNTVPTKEVTTNTAPTKEVTTNTKPTETNNSVTIGSYEQQVVDIVNQERAKAGLAPLSINAKLADVAEKKAEDMRDNNYFSHTSPTYGSPFDMMKQFGITYTAAGENIAKGQRTPQSVMDAWMNSSGHRANILNGNYEQIGVGYVTDSNGNTYWVQEFIK